MKIFETKAALVAATLTAGQIVETKGYTTAGTNNVVVTHGCDFTPNFGDVQVTPRDDPEFRYSVSSLTATTFTIVTTSNVVTDSRFGWRVERTV